MGSHSDIDGIDYGTLDIKTVCECNKCLSTKTLHPLATLINLEKTEIRNEAVKFEFYAILLIEDCPGGCSCCGRKYYDYANATMVFLTPGDIFRMTGDNTLPDKGWLLAFHPDLLHSTTLDSHIRNYTFFWYRKEEALHLSVRETATVTCCLENIETELHHPIDSHTATILSRHIELMLDYCSRFYERQFITRENTNKDIMKRLDRMTEDWILHRTTGTAKSQPAPECFSRSLGLSQAYFKDLLKFETGKTFEEYYLTRQLDEARRMLLRTDSSPATIADRLGFASTQFFCAIFKKLTGKSPADYRTSMN